MNVQKFPSSLPVVIAVLCLICLSVSGPASASQAVLRSVEIGANPLPGWGPPEPTTHGGNWGGLTTGGVGEGVSADNLARVIWYSDLDGSGNCVGGDPDSTSGTLFLGPPSMARAQLQVRHLDGVADDSFDLYVRDPSTNQEVLLGSYADMGSAETWRVTTFNLPDCFLSTVPGVKLDLRFEATGPAWSGFCPYGQLAVDWMALRFLGVLVGYVEIGATDLPGWGPPEPTTHGGNWGGLATGGSGEGDSPDRLARVIWYSDLDGSGSCVGGDPDSTSGSVSITQEYGLSQVIRVRHLDGVADDTFDLFMVNPNTNQEVLLGSYADQTSTEMWMITDFCVPFCLPLGSPAPFQIRFEALGSAWSGFCPYGQLAIDRVELVICFTQVSVLTDIGSANLPGWGPPEPTTHGGNWGGLAQGGVGEGNSPDSLARVTWYSDLDGSGACAGGDPDSTSGTITVNLGGPSVLKMLQLRHLDGIADDSFNLYMVNPADNQEVFVGSYADGGATETWHVTEFCIPPGVEVMGPAALTLRLEATGPAWSQFCPYGQLGFDWIATIGCNPAGILDVPISRIDSRGPAGLVTLHPSFPNPFSRATAITYTLKEESRVSLKIFSISGRLVRDLADVVEAAGTHVKYWDGYDVRGSTVPAGIYLLRLAAPREVQSQRVVFIR